MIPAIILDDTTYQRGRFEAQLRRLCPYLNFPEMQALNEAFSHLLEEKQPTIVFWDPKCIQKQTGIDQTNKVFICVTDTFEHVEVAMQWRAAGYLLKPVEETKLVYVVESASEIIREKRAQQEQAQLVKELLQNKNEEKLIGIPTIEGVEIFRVDEIIRCEGLQKCTRIVTCSKKDIISAYNIGEFKKMLCPIRTFFTPHRSHLINMKYVSSFKKAGVVIMTDGSKVPITCDNKKLFLEYITSL